jgi:sigma-E factor negative regulatory protein RseC
MGVCNMREKAVVVSNKGNNAKVSIMRTTACNHCRGCSVSSGKRIYVWAKNPLKAKAGEVVEIELANSAFLSATFIAYAIPLITLLLGIFIGFKLAMIFDIGLHEIFALTVGIFTMAIGFGFVWIINKKAENSNRYVSSIVGILQHEDLSC